MSYYTGDVVGELVWEYMDDDHIIRYEQDPFLLEKHGGVLTAHCEWAGCHCYVQDNNDPYCMQCYDSAQEHKSVVNTNDMKQKSPSFEMRIHRDTFDARVRPWLQEYEPLVSKDLKELTFTMLHDSVHYNEWDCSPFSPNFNLVQEYCFLKQIEYYFDRMDSQLCWFHIYD